MDTKLRVAVSVCTSILLAACGGGGGGSPTSISAQPASLSFTMSPQSNPTTKDVTATYRGSGAIVGYPPAVPIPTWLSVTESFSTATSIGVAVTASAQGLVPGKYSTTLRFVTATVDQDGNVDNITWDDVPVSLTVVNLSLAPAAVNIEAAEGSTAALPGEFALTINASDAWTATSDKSWLTVDPSGTGPGSLDYAVNPGGLALGSHSGTVTVTGPGGYQDVATVTVTIRAPLLSVDPTSLTFTVDNADPTLSQPLHITDELDGADAARAISWSVQSISESWLQMSPTSGSSAPGLDATVTVKSQSLASMPNGDYSATITLAYTSADGQPRALNVPVTLHLSSPLQSLSVTPATLARIAGQAPVQFTATGTYATGYSANVTSQVTWSSSSVAVDVGNGGTLAKGLAQPVAPGAATLTATMTGTAVWGEATFTVSAPLGYAYMSGIYSSRIYQYLFGDDGELNPIYGRESVSTGAVVGTTRISPSGDYAYAVSGLGIHQFTIAAGGYLVPMSPAVVSGSANTGLIAVEPSGQYLYGNAYDPSSGQYVIRQYSIGSNGALSPLTPASVSVPGSSNIEALPTGGYVYLRATGGLMALAIGADGQLTQLGTTSSSSSSFALHPSGGAAYLLGQYDVSQYAIDASGTLTPMSPASVSAGATIASHIVVDATGKHAYVVDSYYDTIQHFMIGADLKLTATGAEATGVPYTPIDVALEPSGKYLYVTGNNDVLAKFTLDADGNFVGAPTYMDTAAYPRGFAVRGGQ